jgi:hypothetical protein
MRAHHGVTIGDGCGAAYMELAHRGCRCHLPHAQAEEGGATVLGSLELEHQRHGRPPRSCGGSWPLGSG